MRTAIIVLAAFPALGSIPSVSHAVIRDYRFLATVSGGADFAHDGAFQLGDRFMVTYRIDDSVIDTGTPMAGRFDGAVLDFGMVRMPGNLGTYVFSGAWNLPGPLFTNGERVALQVLPSSQPPVGLFDLAFVDIQMFRSNFLDGQGLSYAQEVGDFVPTSFEMQVDFYKPPIGSPPYGFWPTFSVSGFVPAPGSMSVLAMAGLVRIRRRR
ncbi:MAG: hypothetical protein KF805_12980 [Phycisphaeraceae bacterium]|nr:hypothetical protein [Phycisphaeraceae bacterium]